MEKIIDLILNSKASTEIISGFWSVVSVLATYYITKLKTRNDLKKVKFREDEEERAKAEAEALRIEEERKSNSLNFNSVRRRIVEIDRILFELQLKLGCLRIFLLQFHNGGHWFSGDSILRFTITNEAPMEDIERIQKHFQHLIIPAFWLEHIENLYMKGRIHIPDLKLFKNSELRDLMLYYGAQETFDKVICDEYGLPIACLCVHYSVPCSLKPEHIQGIRIEVARIKEILLANRNKIAAAKVLINEPAKTYDEPDSDD